MSTATTIPSRALELDRVEGLRRNLDRLRGLFRSDPDRSAALRLLDRLQELAEGHFEYEERFAKESGSTPEFRLREEGLRLQAEHPTLLDRLQELHDLTESAGSRNDWESLRTAFRNFRIELSDHERREDLLLQEALLRDVGDSGD